MPIKLAKHILITSNVGENPKKLWRDGKNKFIHLSEEISFIKCYYFYVKTLIIYESWIFEHLPHQSQFWKFPMEMAENGCIIIMRTKNNHATLLSISYGYLGTP